MMHEYLVAIDRGARSVSYVKAAEKLGITYKLVDAMDTNIMEELKNVKAFCFHWSHSKYEEKRAAQSIIKAAETMGVVVYPSSTTCGTFDDKIAQKYLLESIDAPLVRSYVFFDKQRALDFLEYAKYPIVHKIAGGAGSRNVGLISDRKSAFKICKRRFFAGILWEDLVGTEPGMKQKLRYFLKERNDKLQGSDRGYLYLQEFCPQNDYDIRVTIIGKRAVIFKRFVREHDFRASGSGKISYEVSKEDERAIPVSFEIADKLDLQTCAFDYIFDEKRNIKLVEMSYGFVSKAVSDARGYYNYHGGYFEGTTVAEEEVLKLITKGQG